MDKKEEINIEFWENDKGDIMVSCKVLLTFEQLSEEVDTEERKLQRLINPDLDEEDIVMSDAWVDAQVDFSKVSAVGKSISEKALLWTYGGILNTNIPYGIALMIFNNDFNGIVEDVENEKTKKQKNK